MTSRTASGILAALLAFAPSAALARPNQTDIDAFNRDPQCGSKAAMSALNQFFLAQGETLTAVGQIADRVTDAAGRVGSASGEATKVLTELGTLAGEAAKSGPEALNQLGALIKAMNELKKNADATSALDLGGVAADGAALVTSVVPFVAECAGCASAMATTITDPAGASAAASGPCGHALEDAAKIQETFAKILRFVDATVRLSQSIQGCTRDLVSGSDTFVKLGQELGKNSQPGLDRIEASLNRSIDAINAAGQTFDSQVAPRVSRLGGALLQQLADNTDRLMTCYGKLQDITARSGPRPKRLPPIRFTGRLVLPNGNALGRAVPRVHLGMLPPTKAR